MHSMQYARIATPGYSVYSLCRFRRVCTDFTGCCRMCPSLSILFTISANTMSLCVCVCVCVCVSRAPAWKTLLLLFSRQSALGSCIIQACSLQCSYSDLLPLTLTLSSFPIFSFLSPFLLLFNFACHIMGGKGGEKYAGYVCSGILFTPYCIMWGPKIWGHIENPDLFSSTLGNQEKVLGFWNKEDECCPVIIWEINSYFCTFNPILSKTS